MKKFKIVLQTGESIIIEGTIIQFSDTGQSIIYSENNPVYTKIVAIIPSTALVIVF